LEFVTIRSLCNLPKDFGSVCSSWKLAKFRKSIALRFPKGEAHKGGHILISRSIPTFGGNQCLWVMCSGKYLKVSRSVGLADGSRI
jgi:hypothetical protein